MGVQFGSMPAEGHATGAIACTTCKGQYFDPNAVGNAIKNTPVSGQTVVTTKPNGKGPRTP